MDILQFLRQFRIGPYTIFDTVISYIGMYAIAPLLTKFTQRFHITISRTGWLWFTMPIAVVFHLIFRQNTPFMKLLFSPETYFLEPLVLVCMLYMGWKNSTFGVRK